MYLWTAFCNRRYPQRLRGSLVMATAVGLNAVSSIVSGQGLSQSPALTSTISTYRSNPAMASFANAYVNAGIVSSITANIVQQLNTVGSGTSGQFLLDLYPSNVSPASSAGITPWTANLVLPAGSLFSFDGKVYSVTGNIFSGSFDGVVLTNSTIAGFTTLLLKQASLPFQSGLSGFANVFQNSYGYAQQVFDTVSSVSMLSGKTYSQTGVNYTGPADLVTGGIGTRGSLLANVVANFGTIYDINNITKIHDPYVFGQNLLNQGLGYVNGLADQLTSVGLDITNLPKIPAVNTTTTQVEKVITVSTFVGEVELPSYEEVTTSTPVTGNSPTVVLNIYKTVTGSNLQAIVNATAVTNTGAISTLADYLDITKVVSANNLTQLNALGITTFENFSQYLGAKVGQGRFKSWADLSAFLNSLETPALSSLPTGAGSPALYSATITNLNSTYGTGSGALGNPVMIDYLGACAGDPYTVRFANIIANYNGLSSTVATSAANLDKAVIDYSNQYLIYLASEVSDSAVPPDPPNNDGVPPDPALLPLFSMITSNVTALNSALSSVPNNSLVNYLNWEWYDMLNRLSTEVANLARAQVTFGAGTPAQLLGFAENIGQYASNKTDLETYQFFSNVIATGFYGDTIRAVIAETINTRVLNNVGITTYNDAEPRAKSYQSQTQNIPLSTYISRNK